MPLKTDRPKGRGLRKRNSSSYLDNFFHPDVKNLVLIITHTKAMKAPAGGIKNYNYYIYLYVHMKTEIFRFYLE